MNFEREYKSFEKEFKNVVSSEKDIAIVSHRNLDCFDFLKKLSNLVKINLDINPKSFSMNQTILVEEELVQSIPKNIPPNNLIIMTKKTSDDKKCFKCPMLPSVVLKWISGKPTEIKMEPKIFINENIRILVVDDNLLILKSLERLLKNLGVKHLKTAKDGLDALEAVKLNDAFDVIFMDISMPRMNGIETANEIRELKEEKKRKTYIVALTGNALPKSLEDQCLEWKMNDILSKPATKQEIIKILKKFNGPSQK
jgi:CheY-like chemotaxis protein